MPLGRRMYTDLISTSKSRVIVFVKNMAYKGEREDTALSSEFSEGKVTEHPGNRVKQLESRLNQAIETSSHVAETVNTKPESDTRTNEGGIFFQALSVPVATSAEHVKTPDSCETTTTEDQEEGSGASKIEILTEEKPNDDEQVAVIAVKETDDKSVDAQEASEQSENGARDESEEKPVEIEQEEQPEVIRPIVEIVEKIEQKDDQEEATKSDDGRKETSDIPKVKEVCEEAASEKVESEKEVEVSDISSEDNESSEPELVETKEIIEKDTRETEYNATTPTEPEEITPKNEEKNEEEVIDSNDDQTKKSEEVSNLPDDSSMVSNELILSKENEDKLYVSEKGQGDGDDVTSSQNASTEFIKETTTSQHATAPAYFEEGRDLNVTPKDILKEEEDERTTHPQEESEQCENEAKDNREQKQEESVNEIVHSSLEIEQENDTEEIKPSDEKQGDVITADASNSTQTKSHVESAEHEVNNEEATIESDEGVKLSGNSSMKQNEETVEILSKNEGQEMERELNSSEKDQGEDDATCKETVPEKANEYEEGLIHSDSSSIVLNENEIVSKDEYQEKEQEFYVSEKGQHGGDDVTGSQNASSEDIKEMIDQHDTKVAYFEEVQGLNAMDNDGEATHRMIVPQEASEQNENEANDKREQKPEEIMHSGLKTEQEEYAKEIKPSVKTEVKEEQEGLVGISSQTEIQVQSQLEATEHEEEAIESDDGPKEKANNPLTKEVCEEIDAGKVEYEGVQLSDDSSEKLDEKAIAILSKEEDRETEEELKIEQDQHEDGVPSSQDATSVEDLQAKSHDGEGQEPEVVETREGIQEDNEEIKPSVERKEKVEQEGLLHATTTDVCIITQRKSQEEATKGKDDQREKSNDALVEEVCKEVGSEKVEPEEGMKLSDNSNIELNEKAIAISSKDEDQENEQELSMQEETQGEEEVTCSQEASSGKDLEGKKYDSEQIEPELVENRESIKEDIEVTSANVDTEEIKEQQGSLSAQTEPKEETTKDGESIESYDDREEKLVIPCVNEACEETSLESIDAQEASEQYENEAKDKREQDLEESSNKPVHSHSEISEATIKEDETNAESKEEAYFEKPKFEASDETECKTAGENISAENKDDAIADESKSTENPCTAEQDILEEVGEKTTTKPEEITKQASQESQSETNKEIEKQIRCRRISSWRTRRWKLFINILKKYVNQVSTKLGQPMEHHVEENQACQTTTMDEKIEDEIAKKDEDLSLGSIEVSDDNTVKEEKSFLDGKTREIEISTLEHEPVEEKTATKSEEITKQAFQESQSETNKKIEAKLDAENQAEGGEDESEMTDEVVLTEKACGTTTTSEKIEDDIAEKIEDLSLGTIEDKNDNDIKEEESFLDERTREIEISTLEHAPVGEKTTMESEDISKQVIQESQIETNKEIEAKLDAEYQADGREDKSETKDDVVMTTEMSSELGQPVEQNAEIQACRTTTMSEEIEDEITEKYEDLSHGSVEDKDDNIVKEEKSFLDEKTREIETATLEHEPVAEKTTTSSEEITKQALQESEIETNEEIDTKLDAENQAEEREDRRETKDEVALTEKMSLELEQPVEENIEEISSCQTTTVSGKIEDEITEKNEDLSLGNIEDKDDNIVKEEKSFLDEKAREIEISTLEHVPVGEKTTMEPEDITKQAFQESEFETNKKIEAKLDVEYQADERQDRNEIEDEVVLTKKISSELEQPLEQNVEEIQACQTTTMNEKAEDEITKKDEDLSMGNIEVSDDNTIKEEESFLDERTREIEISAFEHEPVGEKTTIKPEEITEHASQESQSETAKEIEAKLDAKNQVDEREDKSEIKDEMSLELEQPMEDNVEEMPSCQTTTVSGKVEDEITEKNEDLSLGSIEDKDDNIVKEEKSFLDEKTREIEISTLEHVPVGEKTTTEPEDITKQAFQESKIETDKEIEAKLDAEYQADGREDKSETKDDVVMTKEIEDAIAEKKEDLSLGNREDTNDDIVKEEKGFLDGNAREIEISTLENEHVVKLEEITEQAFQESHVEINKEIEAKLDAENPADEEEKRREIKDEVVLTKKLSSELGQPMEHHVEENQACRTTTMDEKIEDEIAKKDEDLSLGSIEVSDDNTVKEEKSFLDGKTREIEISTLEHEPVEDKTTTKSEEITKQALQESQSETNKEIEAKLDAENQAEGGEDESEMTDEVVLTEKVSSELGQPMEQNIEEIQACQTTTMTEKTEDEIVKNVDLSHDSTEDTNENTIEEENSFLGGKTREIEISTSEHETVEEKNGGLDEVPKKKHADLNEATTVELQPDFIPSISPGISTTDNTPNSENSKAESENLPIEDLDSVSEVQIPRVVPNSEDSNVKEECLISATTTAVDEERRNVTKETSSDEISYSDPIPVENPEVIKAIVDAQIEVADSEESKVKEERIDLATGEYADENNGDEEQGIRTNEISSVENLELHGELKPTSELMIDDDQVDETKPQPEQSDITSEQVVVETEKEEGSTEVKQHDCEEDNCPKELEKTSTSNQKELDNEIEVSKSIPTGNTEVAEIESIDTPSNDQDDMKLRESMLIEQKGVLSSQLTDREILEEEAIENRKEAPNHEFEKDEKDDGLISEIQTPEANLKMEIKEEHLEATNETVTGGLSSEKLLDEVKEIDAKEDTEIIVRQEEEVVEDSYQEAVAEVTAHDHLPQTEEKLVSMVPPEELTSPKFEEQTNELVSETDKTKVEHSSVSSKDWNPELMEEKFTKTLLEDQRSTKEQYTEEEGQDNVGAESKEAKTGNEVVEDVIVNEVLLEVEKAKESDNINKEGSFIPNHLTSATDEVCQIKSLDSSPNELLEQDKEVKSEEISGQGDTHKLEEEPTEVFELTPEVDEIVGEGIEVSAMLTENLPEGSPEMLLVKQDPETTTIIEKSEEEIKDKDKTLVNMDFSTSSEEVACLSNEKAEELQVSTLNAEGKQDGLIDMLNKETEAVQPQEHISDIKSVDPPSDVEIREQGELLHCGSQEPSVQQETIQCVDKTFEEAPAIDDQKHENDLDYTASARVIDVVSKAESPEIEQQHLDTKEAKVKPINQENQSGQTKEESENIESEIPIEKVPKPTVAHEETANEFLVVPVATEEEKLNYLQDYSKEEEHSGKRTYQDLEAVTEPSQTDKLTDEVTKAEPIDTQEETKDEGKLHEEKTGKRTKITEETVDLHHGEKGDETHCKATSTEAAIPIEYVNSSDMVKGDLDASVPMCASTRNPEVRSATLEVLSVMDATDDKAGYSKDSNDKTAEAHEAEKEVPKEDIHLESACGISKTTEKISGTNQEPFNLPLTKERSMELDAPVTPGTAATEEVENSQKYEDDGLIKTSQIQPELQKDEVSACAVDKQFPDKPYQDESTESKLLTANINASDEQGKPTAKSLTASGTEPQCSSEVVKEEKKISDEKEKPETPEQATVVITDILHEPTQANSKVTENLIKERGLDLTKDEQVDKEETGDKGAKTDEEDEAEEDDEDNQKTGDAPVMVEASKDMEVKTPKKSHNILSGVGSKVKHSIAKVKKAITGKSSSPKPPSPKARD
ncbi:hypothetical protein OSB04_007730 [Centaurea solstitialis]|uniref:Uncharacterized protein n=1 Tax=Centaurea solstitialis TaxID=347529 RepID=A0AA38TX25_9ASTR|nr:hypothetical protein OSB04_007730 [Centaurea solstitialis]